MKQSASHPRRVALVVESAVAPRRMMLTGVARYIQEHEPWALYLKPVAVEKSLKLWLENWEGDGVIAAVGDIDAAFVSHIDIPVVDVVGVMRNPRVPLVHTDDFAVGRLGAEHLLERGFRSFAFCEYEDQFWSVHRREGFERYLAEKGYSVLVHRMRYPTVAESGPLYWERQQARIAAWLESAPKPLGLMATNDLMGQQLLEACLRLKVNVPEAIAVVGADNDEPICRIAYPPLSSVIIDDHQRGYEAAALLDRLMKGEDPPKEPTYVPPTGVRTRASTDVLATDDKVVADAVRYIREHAVESIAVTEVARAVHASRSLLERRFRKVIGRSVNNEIVRMRLNRAIELLTETELELKVIAHRAGFGTQAYMNAVFQSKLKRTPGSYRPRK